MLWPEGSVGTVAELGSYVDPPIENEPVVAFAVSRASSYLAVASARVVVLFRLKPFMPLSVYPELFQGTHITDIVASPRGDHLAVLTADHRVSVFAILPGQDIEEVLRLTCIVTPGPGEAIGARELMMEPVGSIYSERSTLSLDAVGGTLLVYCQDSVQSAAWPAFESHDPLQPPALSTRPLTSLQNNELVVRGTSELLGRHKWVSCLVTSQGRLLLVYYTLVGQPKHLEALEVVCNGIDDVFCVDFNARMGKLAVLTNPGRVFVLRDISKPQQPLLELPSEGARLPRTLKWTPSGTALLVGYADGWRLLTLLGLELYNHRARSEDVGEGVVQADWLAGAETLVFADSDGRVRLQNMLRWSGSAGAERSRPVLHGNGRLLLYHDPNFRGISTADGANSQAWLTIPLPTWYMAQNWPIAHICSSPDGRYVAVAGTIGIMLFSVATRQWKEVGDRESMVRGGLCWHGRRLIAATVGADDGLSSIKMFSPVGSSANGASSPGLFGSQFLKPKRRSLASPSTASSSTPLVTALPSSASITGLGATKEQQIVARDVLGKGSLISLMARGPQGLLAVLAGRDTQRLLIYDLSNNEFDLVRDMPLASVLAGLSPPPVARAVSLVSESRVLVLAGTTLLLVSAVDDDSRKYQRQVVADPIESFEYLAAEQQLWVFDGQNAVVTDWNPAQAQSALDELGADGTVVDSRHTNPESPSESRESTPTGLNASRLQPSGAQTQGTDFPSSKQGSPDPRVEAEGKIFSAACGSRRGSTQRASGRYVASVPLDAYPVHYSANRGVMSLVEAEPVRSYDGNFVVARPTTSHEVYIPYLLEAALVPAYREAVEIARKYARMPYFPGILESLLYRAVTNDDDVGETRFAVALIREFPTQNLEAIVAGCARKVEMNYWKRLFDAVGKSPAMLFDECLEKLDLETANEFLLVVQSTSNEQTPSLDLSGRLLKLYNAASEADQLWICKQLCDFVMAVDPSGSSLREFRSLVSPHAQNGLAVAS